MVEYWLADNPFTSDIPDKAHYRVYMLNLENLTPVGQGGIPLEPVILTLVGGITVVIIAGAIVWRRKYK